LYIDPDDDPILSYPDFKKEFIIRTDASLKGIGDVLLQKEGDSLEHPICCISRTLSTSEKNYSVTDLEGLAVIFSLKYFSQYILSNKNLTKFITDHKPLLEFFKKSIPTSNRHARW